MSTRDIIATFQEMYGAETSQNRGVQHILIGGVDGLIPFLGSSISSATNF